MEHNTSKLVGFARDLRKQQTDAETLMWRLLRNRRVANAKFRRQHPIEKCITDFYCHEHKLIIELDGGQHFEDKGILRDRVRTQRLGELGLRVLRFDNRQVLLETEAVLEQIYQIVTEKLPLIPGPSPGGRREYLALFPGVAEGVLREGKILDKQ